MEKGDDSNDSTPSGNSASIFTEQQVTYFLTQKVDEVTGSQMKKVEVQKMEDSLTIKSLEREYQGIKQNLIFLSRKLEESQKAASIQSETINQLERANKAVIDKFLELKRFQNDIILSNINESEKSFMSCQDKAQELSKIFDEIGEQQTHTKNLQNEISQREEKLNADVIRQIDSKTAFLESRRETVEELKKKYEGLEKKVKEAESDENLKTIINEKTKRIIELEAEEEANNNKIREEINHLTDEKKKLQEILKMGMKSVEEKKTLKSKLESELESLEKHKHVLKESLEQTIAKREELMNEAMSRRKNMESSKKIFEENCSTIQQQIDQCSSEIVKAKSQFTTAEEDMQSELKTLHGKVEEKRKLVKLLDDYQKELKKLKESKTAKQRELHIFKDKILNELKKLNDEVKKHEQLVKSRSAEINELNFKIKGLETKKVNVQLKSQVNTQDQLSYKKSYKSQTDRVDIPSSQRVSQVHKETAEDTLSAKSTKKSVNPYLYDSDESDNERDYLSYSSQKKSGSSTSSQRKTVYSDWSSQNASKKTNESTSEKLFEELLTQRSSEAPETSKDADVFKIPKSYSTPMKKKSTLTKKY
ncbi:hypothetical protein QAD02_016194 [Eretmocerus hayati]|uniref:Uncharacterized protein n=1 Tax=Eretmocerus hayati TaxID=131215 RepID=A0ACC2PAS7_9HYME|nr:hypothetical protein QAD02_016194 [Eretmocerus hayati]